MVPISTAGSASGAKAAATDEGSIVGRSPWTLTTMSIAPGRIDEAERLVDSRRAILVIGARQHRLAAGALGRQPRSRRHRSPRRPDRSPPRRRGARHARSSATPWISASGLPGSRVEAMRAGTSTRARSRQAHSLALRRHSRRGCQKVSTALTVHTYCAGTAKACSFRATCDGWQRQPTARQVRDCSMPGAGTDGFFRAQQDSWRGPRSRFWW